jgi:uncharacterized membrane protein
MKKVIIEVLIVLASALLLVLGYFAVEGDTAYATVGSGLEYYRAEVEDIVRIDNSAMSYDIVFSAKITSGDRKGETVEATQNVIPGDVRNAKDVELGDKVLVFCGGSETEQWFFGQYIRSDMLLILLALFIVCLIAFGRGKGVKTVVSLILTVAAVFTVLVPAVINCENIYFWAIFTAFYIVIMTLAIVNGLNRLSLSAVLGCVCGVLISALLVLISDAVMKLSGFVDESSIYLLYIGNGGTVDLRAITFASIIIGAVGAVMDVSVDISASLHEIAVKVRRPRFSELVRSGFNIGRNIVGTMSNTLILAYIGCSLSSLLLYVCNNGDSLLNIFNREQIVVEALQILVGSLGLLMTLPAATLIGSFFYSRAGYRKTLDELARESDDADEFSKELEMMLKSENDTTN